MRPGNSSGSYCVHGREGCSPCEGLKATSSLPFLFSDANRLPRPKTATYRAEDAVRAGQTLQADGEANVAGAHHVLDFKLLECDGKAQLLENPCVLRRSGSWRWKVGCCISGVRVAQLSKPSPYRCKIAQINSAAAIPFVQRGATLARSLPLYRPVTQSSHKGRGLEQLWMPLHSTMSQETPPLACLANGVQQSTSRLTILPEAKMSAVLFGSLILMITAAKRLGLYSAFLACKAIAFKSNLHSKFTVATTFCGFKPGTCLTACTVRSNNAPVTKGTRNVPEAAGQCRSGGRTSPQPLRHPPARWRCSGPPTSGSTQEGTR